MDAVNQTQNTGWDNTILPDNILRSSHARKTKKQLIYPTMQYAIQNNRFFYKNLNIKSTTEHGEIGMGWLDDEGNRNNTVLNWFIREAQNAGVIQ